MSADQYFFSPLAVVLVSRYLVYLSLLHSPSTDLLIIFQNNPFYKLSLYYVNVLNRMCYLHFTSRGVAINFFRPSGKYIFQKPHTFNWLNRFSLCIHQMFHTKCMYHFYSCYSLIYIKFKLRKRVFNYPGTLSPSLHRLGNLLTTVSFD